MYPSEIAKGPKKANFDSLTICTHLTYCQCYKSGAFRRTSERRIYSSRYGPILQKDRAQKSSHQVEVGY